MVAEGAEKSGKRTRIGLAATAEEAAGLVRSMVSRGDMVLLKGSRGVHLETVYEQY
jgi:UDP-N-acetylmuramyl pentapeptide synthase